MNHNFPKVLLVCGFNQNTANGITISNLFQKWPSEKIAVLEYSSNIQDIAVSNIEKYYCLGSRETTLVWPFRHFQKVRQSCHFNKYIKDKVQHEEVKNDIIRTQSSIKRLLFKLKLNFLYITGLIYKTRKYTISDVLDTWIQNFNPDIIYGTTEDLEKMNFLLILKNRYQKKLAIHTFDDWVHSGHRYHFLQRYWNKKMITTFKKTLDKSDIRLTISDKMSNEYSQKYNLSFHAFHNPVDTNFWNADNFLKNSQKESIFTFIYAGKVNRDTIQPLQQFIRAIESLKNEGLNIAFSIYSPYDIKVIYEYLGQNAKKYFKGTVEYEMLPVIFKRSHALLLPLAFNKDTINYIRLSMLTKATEYMISGTPIFLYTPDNVAVSEYLTSHKAAYKHENSLSLSTSIKKFINDYTNAMKFASNAKKRAEQFHSIERVTANLQKVLNLNR
ncbi:hypothetical protein AAG747_24675 [Rapidithrix thailandica]|uniref:Glycosyltransferase n=1 Tax=Rapidithrix thailandica TaxID=413964 RepID=A0AAW9S7H0_9BACT